MTAIPAERGTGVQLMCDDCGDVTVTDGCGLHDADLVYVAVTGVGWTGSAFARGPHRCPGCSTRKREQHPAPTRPAVPTAVLDRVRVAHLGSVAMVQVRGDIDADVAADLRCALDTALAVHRTIIVDLGAAGVIDSVSLGVLVRARNAARHHHGEVILAAPSRFVQTVLRTMRLHTAFRTFGTVERAITGVGGNDSAESGPVPRVGKLRA